MSHTTKLGWFQGVLAERMGQRDPERGAVTEAKFYLAVGKMVQRRILLGARPESIGQTLGLPIRDLFYALLYADSATSFVLRSLVEEWSWRQIKAGLNQPLSGCDPVPRKGWRLLWARAWTRLTRA